MFIPGQTTFIYKGNSFRVIINSKPHGVKALGWGDGGLTQAPRLLGGMEAAGKNGDFQVRGRKDSERNEGVGSLPGSTGIVQWLAASRRHLEPDLIWQVCVCWGRGGSSCPQMSPAPPHPNA